MLSTYLLSFIKLLLVVIATVPSISVSFSITPRPAAFCLKDSLPKKPLFFVKKSECGRIPVPINQKVLFNNKHSPPTFLSVELKYKSKP